MPRPAVPVARTRIVPPDTSSVPTFTAYDFEGSITGYVPEAMSAVVRSDDVPPLVVVDDVSVT